MPDLMRIGQLCETADVTPRTVRHYETQKLLSPVATTLGGQRLYAVEAVDTVRAVRTLQEVGYSLRRIKRVFMTAARQQGTGKRIVVQLRHVVKEIEFELTRRVHQLEEAQHRVSALAKSTANCDSCPGNSCHGCPALGKLRTLGLQAPQDTQ